MMIMAFSKTTSELKTDRANDDASVIARVVSGETDAYEILLSRYEAHVFRIVKRHVPVDDVSEVCHNAFISAYTSLGSYKNEADFSHWLSKIAVRTCHDFWRKKYRQKETPISTLSDDHVAWLEKNVTNNNGAHPKAASRESEAKEILEHTLSKLSATDRMLLTLVHLEGNTVKEAAKILGITLVNAKVRSHRAKAKLRNLIAELIEENND